MQPTLRLAASSLTLAFYQSAAEKWLRFFALLIPAYFVWASSSTDTGGWATLDAAYTSPLR